MDRWAGDRRVVALVAAYYGLLDVTHIIYYIRWRRRRKCARERESDGSE